MAIALVAAPIHYEDGSRLANQVYFDPEWNLYLLYELVHEYDGIHKLFNFCYKYNLHSIWASQELYRKGNSREMFYNILQKNMQPVYDSAKRQGYEVWNW